MGQQRKSNWIEEQIKRMGEDFIYYMNPERIQKAAKTRIFRDMVNGNIDYEVYGKYFEDSKFLENLIIAANSELLNNSIILTALIEFDNKYPGDANVIALRTKHHSLCVVYQNIYDRLINVKANYNNIGYLSDLSATLRFYRNVL